MIMFFEFIQKKVRTDAGPFSAKVGQSYIQNMSSIYLQNKYNILEIDKTTIKINY
jgi:hypothetical protein